MLNAEHGLKDSDIEMLVHLSQLLLDEHGHQRFTLQAVITKSDTISSVDGRVHIAKLKKGILDAAPLCLAPIITSAQMSPPFGIHELRCNIVEACGVRTRVP